MRYLEGYDPVQSAYLVEGFSIELPIESEGLEEKGLGVDNARLPKHLLPILEKKKR